MSTESQGSPYAVALDVLESDVRVPPDGQVQSQPVVSGGSSWAWREEHRQARLAGGA